MSITMRSLESSSNWIPVKYVEAHGHDREEARRQVQRLLQVTGPGSVIVANYGLHFQHTFSTTGRPALLHIVRDLLLAVTSTDANRRPRLLWREGTPQQYPITANGWWSPAARSCPARAACCACVALTPAMRKGNVTADAKNTSSWDVFPAQAMDEVVLPLLREYRVPVIRVYEALAARGDLHAGFRPPDCTHFGPDALLYLNAQVLKAIVTEVT
mmetsp:Transcript_15024/g.28262  ORF Transcript_15024/g.28262 Transcript_15024/m.28262 type:complete len:215 (-) Transcript_15024:172-816(-)